MCPHPHYDQDKSMTKVFFGGSRRIGRLSQKVRERTDEFLSEGCRVLLGDANGADKAMQKYLADKCYSRVVVFCMGGTCRNNIGGWKTQNIRCDRGKKDFDYYNVKDAFMSREADCGFMLWDGRSKGTVNSIVNLLERSKQVLVYYSPARSFHHLSSPSDLWSLPDDRGEDPLSELDEALGIRTRLQQTRLQLNVV